MSVRKIEIELGLHPGDRRILIDGRDVSEITYAVQVQMTVANEPPVVCLGMYAVNEQGAFYADQERGDVAKRFLEFKPDRVVITGDAALTELVANVDRHSTPRRPGRKS